MHCLAMTLLPNLQNLQKVENDIVIMFNGNVAYSVMRDKHDARRVPMERGWVALYLYATHKYSNQLTFEYGLPFLYALYIMGRRGATAGGGGGEGGGQGEVAPYSVLFCFCLLAQKSWW